MSPTRRLYDRREILAGAASAAVVASLPSGSLATPALGAPRVEPLADWSIDDQWGVVPRAVQPRYPMRGQSWSTRS